MDKPEGFLDLEYRTRRALLLLVYLVIAGMLAMMLYYARPAISFVLTILSPFIVALIVSYIFNPVVNWLQRRFKVGRISGVVLTYALILLIVAGFFSLLVPILYGQAKAGITSIINNFPNIIDKATTWLSLKVTPEEMTQAREFFEENFDMEKITGSAGTTVSRVTQQAFDTTKFLTRIVGTSISLLIGGIAFLSFVIVICFYFLLDYHRMEHIARVLLPDDKESRVFAIWSRIDDALGGYLRGQLIVASIVGVIYTVALMLMGMQEYAILIGFMAGFGNMIPYAGPVIGGVPAGLWVLFGNTYDTAQEKMIGIGLIIALSIAVQTLDGLYMQPRIVGKNAELHPLLVLLALLIGAQFGLGGLIIAVPLAIMLRVVLKELWWDPLERIEYESKRQAAAAAGDPMADSSAAKQRILPNLRFRRDTQPIVPANELAALSSDDASQEAGYPAHMAVDTAPTAAATAPPPPDASANDQPKKSRNRRRRR